LIEIIHLSGMKARRYVISRSQKARIEAATLIKYFESRMVSSGILRRVSVVRTDVSEEPNASFIRVTRIGELGTTLAATSN
jgi:hypothetical protein